MLGIIKRNFRGLKYDAFLVLYKEASICMSPADTDSVCLKTRRSDNRIQRKITSQGNSKLSVFESMESRRGTPYRCILMSVGLVSKDTYIESTA